MVLQYANGNLRNYLNSLHYRSWFDWHIRLNVLNGITHGIKNIHAKGIIHRDLHIEKQVYGVLPYVALEILRGQGYTKASDIYSFGMLMYEVLSGSPPYHDVSYDVNLAIKISQGLRPRFNVKVPRMFVHLVKRCLDANPLNRPTAGEIEDLIKKWN
ncbi:unnamed protein product [Rhizophagus irregularis]|nr:unnamed protein product [Rhizophagus irregularis]